MTSSTKRPRSSRRFAWLAAGIVVAIAAYTAAWYALAGYLMDRTDEIVAALNRGGDRAACENAQARGYPFRIGVFCSSAFFEDRGRGLAISTRDVRSAAQVYNPFRVVAEADGPARVAIAGLDPLDVRWTSMRASARLARPLPDRLSVELRDVAAEADVLGQRGVDVFSASLLELHMRPNGDDADVALRFDGLVAGQDYLAIGALPALGGTADISWLGGALQAAAGTMELRGSSFRIRGIDLTAANGAALNLSGDLRVRPDGLIDAALQLTATDAKALGELLVAAFPESADQIGNVVTGLSVLGQRPSLPLRIAQGRMTLGFVPLGALPPL